MFLLLLLYLAGMPLSSIMEIVQTSNINSLQKENILRLWNTAYPSSIVYTGVEQLDHYLNALAGIKHYFLMTAESTIAGWAVTFIRDNETWFALIIDKGFQGKGLGSFILAHLKEYNAQLNGWVIEEGHYLKSDGTIYEAPLQFYLKNGFSLVKDVRLEIPQMKAVKIRWEAY